MLRQSPIPMDECGMAKTAQLLGDKWSLLIIREAFYGVARFDDIRNDIGIPRAVLTDRLKKLLAAEVLKKVPYREPGKRARDAYILDDAGKELALLLIASMQWGDKYLNEGQSSLAIFERDSDEPVRAELVNSKGQKVALSELRYQVTGRK